ncbi:alpha/beta-hydrolase [Hyaloscypha variabilis F]|uniref:Carboxylic ester hydrolase n=1 Tax=Hyaloscypha variabilis (strain UAMH 11265 / GT02V1 / F) TaxID=1149755 RepID=A0A2J6R1B6_HYAVF|nr:alpha/beta-hydrolase [Hyaloscypha variabilis F]
MANGYFDNHLEDFTLSIGKIQLKGFISKQGIANFLNIPYAKAPVRFRTATPISISNHHADLDASRYGPRCPQEATERESLMAHLYEKVSSSQAPDEVNCLHLNIYTPPAATSLTTASRLPVFVWIHGGAFNVGDNTTQFDGNHLIKRSLEIGRPIIIVSINYRLNVFGFLSSQELIEETKSLGEDFIPNQGLNDQRIALQWIQSSIHHFGGDASRVTIAGESAGAVSVLYHLKGGLPLFQQALLQSPPAPRLWTPEEAQSRFDKLVESAGISYDASGADKLAALRSLTTEQLVDIFDKSFSFPVEDPHWFPGYD